MKSKIESRKYESQANDIDLKTQTNKQHNQKLICVLLCCLFVGLFCVLFVSLCVFCFVFFVCRNRAWSLKSKIEFRKKEKQTTEIKPKTHKKKHETTKQPKQPKTHLCPFVLFCCCFGFCVVFCSFGCIVRRFRFYAWFMCFLFVFFCIGIVLGA